MTHCDRLLAVLADGREHDHHELYALGMIVHSRIADLRRRGHVIEHRRDGDLSLYRLVELGDTHGQAPSGPRGLGGMEALVRVAEPGALDGVRPPAPSPEVAAGPVERVPDEGPAVRSPEQPRGALALVIEDDGQIAIGLGAAA